MATIQQITATENLSGQDPADPTAFAFELSTDPDPLRVSPASGDPERADLVIVGSRRGASVDCRKITVHVPTGNKSPDLTPDLNSVTPKISLDGWTPSTDPTAKTITFTPAGDRATIGPDQGITIQLMGMRINTEVGSSPLQIDVEWAQSGSEGWKTDPTVIDVGKFPADFVLRNFIPEELVIDNGGSVKLNWEAGGVSSLKLLYDVAEVNVLDRSTFTVPNVRSTTVFYLRATVQNGTGTAERILSATVTVRVPDLEVRNLTVTGNLTAVTEGTFAQIRELRGGEVREGAFITEKLIVNSHVKILPGESLEYDRLTVGGKLTVDGGLTVGGNVDAVAEGKVVRIRDLRGPGGEPLTIDSPVNVLKDNNVTIAGRLTVGGNVDAVAEGKVVRIRDLRGPGGEPLTI
ncbi:hypothetical protein, partial [Kitasatospora sp. NPDC098663]|uniref:hypothetical protein n=1 Tax=Kitasatospora sp. NPDC098663 TaxID=3364096 RepID=UPI00382E7BCD